MDREELAAYIADLEACLSSKTWMEVRGATDAGNGQTLAEAFRAELAAAKVKMKGAR